MKKRLKAMEANGELAGLRQAVQFKEDVFVVGKGPPSS
jgi:hypothetical protein